MQIFPLNTLLNHGQTMEKSIISILLYWQTIQTTSCWTTFHTCSDLFNLFMIVFAWLSVWLLTMLTRCTLFTNTLLCHHLKIKKVSAVTELNSNEKTGHALQNIYIRIKSRKFRDTTAKTFSVGFMHYNVSFAEVSLS